MKMHSYMSINGHLQYINVQASDILTKLRDATLPHGGWDFALSTAKARRAELDAATAQESTDEFTPAATPSGVSDGTRTSIVDAETATALRRRLLAASAGKRENLHPEDARFTREKVDGVLDPLGSHTLLDHPDEIISNLAREHSDLEAELTSRGPEHIRWPDNITLKFFAVYQLIPTLVYELEYPRTDRWVAILLRLAEHSRKSSIRPLYLFEKTVATFGTFALLYTVTESFILPLTPTPEQSFFRSLLDLALPFMIAYLLLFFIIFGES
jgi:sterol O-acyltransferase